MSKLTAYFVALAAGFLMGWSAHWKLTEPQTVRLVPTPAQRLAHGGLQLEARVGPLPRPAQALPPGAKARHVGSAVLQPYRKGRAAPGKKRGASEAADIAPEQFPTAEDCGPVHVDYTLYRSPEGQEFMRMSSPDGEVVEGVDTAVAERRPPPHRWAVGAGRNLDGQGGLRVDYDFSSLPLRVGVAVQQSGSSGIVPGVWVMLRF